MRTRFTIITMPAIVGTVSDKDLVFKANGKVLFTSRNICFVEKLDTFANSGRLGKGLAYGALGTLAGGFGIGALASVVGGANGGADVYCMVHLTNAQQIALVVDQNVYVALLANCLFKAPPINSTPITDSKDFRMATAQRPRVSTWPSLFWFAVLAFFVGLWLFGKASNWGTAALPIGFPVLAVWAVRKLFPATHEL